MSYRDKKTGQIITDEQFNGLPEDNWFNYEYVYDQPGSGSTQPTMNAATSDVYTHVPVSGPKDWPNLYYNRYLDYEKEKGRTPMGRQEFGNKVNEAAPGGFEGSFSALINTLDTEQGVVDTKNKSEEEAKNKFIGNVDTAVAKGFLTEDQAGQLKGMYDSGLGDQARANLTTWVNNTITKKNNPTVPQTPDDITGKNEAEQRTKFENSVSAALGQGFITQDQADQLIGTKAVGDVPGKKGLYDINPENALLSLNTWVNKAVETKNTPAVPKFEYVEPDYVTQAKKIIQEEMAINPEFNVETVKKWFPTLLEASAPAKQADLEQNTSLMNSLGRMYSGQTIKNSQDIGNRYNMAALDKALGYAYDEFGRKIATKEGAINKNLAIGEYETGIKKYQNQQDVDQALRDLTQNLTNINTNKATNTDAITQALQRMYQTQDTSQGINWNTILGENSTNAKDLESLISRIYANEDWTKNANLTSWLASLNKDQGFDWTKILMPTATVAAAAI